MGNGKYILTPEGDVQPVDLMTWAKWFEANPTANRIAETTLSDGRWVSTVFLGIDYRFGSGPPLLFETMVFPSKDNLSDERCERYSTKAEAEAGHLAVVKECELELVK